MRCLTLADALSQRSATVRFVSRHLPEHLRLMLAAKGHEFVSLKSSFSEVGVDALAHAHWLGTSQYVDAQECIHALSDQVWDWLIVDHYALDICWEAAHRLSARNILVIDDLANRQHNCDLLLDQNVYADMDTRYKGKVPANCRLLLGPSYALLRDKFRQLHGQVKPRTGPVKRVLVFYGGVDIDNYTGRTIEALVNFGTKDLKIDVVIGARHPHGKLIVAECAEHQFNCYVQTNCMAELMLGADLAIGAGGSATWERCCLGLPTFTICTAENQARQVADAASEGLLYAPEITSDLVDGIGRHLRVLFENPHLRQSISRSAMEVVDGRGVLRVIGMLDCSNIKIRLAVKEDSKSLFEWRNHLSVRTVSNNTEMLDWESHQRWFESALDDPNRSLLIGHRDGMPVGVVRFDLQGSGSEVSIYLVPGMRGAGLGGKLLRSAERWYSDNRSEVQTLRAHVRRGNGSSQRLFIEAGYHEESTAYTKRLK